MKRIFVTAFTTLAMLSMGMFVLSCSRIGIPGPEVQSAVMVSDDLTNGNVRALAEDSYGHIWIGTRMGLNRFTGNEYFQYFHSEEENSIGNNQISSFFKDSKGRFWVLTRGGACIYTEKDDFLRAAVSQENEDIKAMVETDSGRIIAFTYLGKCLLLDENTFSLQEIESDYDRRGFSYSTILHKRGWKEKVAVILSGAAFLLDTTTGESETVLEVSKDNLITGALLDKSGNLIINREKGIIAFGSDDRSEFVPWWAEEVQKKGLVAEDILSDGDIIMVRTEKGFFVFDQSSETLYPPEDPLCPYDIPQDFIANILLMDRRNAMWLGSETKGVAVISSADKIFNKNSALIRKFQNENIRAITFDSEDKLWILSEEGNLMMATPGGVRTDFGAVLPYRTTPGSLKCDPTDGTIVAARGREITRWRFVGNRLVKLSSSVLNDNVSKLCITPEGELIAGFYEGNIAVLDRNDFSTKETFKAAETSLENSPSNRVYDIDYLGDGDICVAFYRNNPNIININSGRRSIIDLRGQTGDFLYITSVYKDGDGALFFGTNEHGLMKYSSSGEWTEVKGIDNIYISEIAPCGEESLWISTSRGIYLYDKSSGKTAVFHEENGTGVEQFNPSCVALLSDGTVIFGGNRGLTSCHSIPASSNDNFKIPFESLMVNNVYVRPSEGGCIEKAMHLQPEIVLEHDQNNIAVSFATRTFLQYQPSGFRYRLYGYDRGWTDIGNHTIVRYSNLPPGNYRLKVVGDYINGDTIESDYLSIRVRRSFWSSYFMMGFYFFVLLSLACLFISIRKRSIEDRRTLERQKIEQEQEKSLYDQNISFFSNMVHEIRSPLTLITGPLDQLLSDDTIGKKEHGLLDIMKVHMNRLTKMLNQILDVNNMEDKSRSLEVVADFPIGEKMGNMIKNILPVAASQSITVKCEGLDSDLRVPVDVDKFETIFSNLLSNALKYTSGDSMEMNISLSHNGSGAAVVEVFNNCSAIPEEEIGKLFDRFYQMKRRSKDKRIAGTGIGLHYSKALAEIHHGTLTASYDDSLRGITFRLSLPDSIEAYAEEEILSDSAHLTIMEDTETILQADNEADVVNKYSESKANVMVIDDDVDIANYLKLLLSDYYNVTCFYRAEEAVEEFNRNHLPDIVLSDVIMSGMDGINLCKYIKDNDLTCHIPVILVTAKVDEENKVNGLDSGADAYVTKPFEPAYLVSLVRSLLKNRNLSRGTFAQISEILSLDTGILSEEDKTFLNDLAGILEKEISNPDLDIPTISSGLNVSRSKLFYRIKGLTGMSPLELLKTYRLKLAAKLLKEGKYNVSEVSEIVGFSSLSYFSTVFKKEFGITPKDAKK